MITTKIFGMLPDGIEITEYTLRNKNKMTVKIINYGAIITSITIPDKNGAAHEITLGYDNLDDYVNNNKPYFGATVGRVAGRIRGAKFTLNDEVYHLTKNHGADHLHGGVPGFHRVVWNAEDYVDDDACGVVMNYFSPDEEAGYPGNVGVVVSFHLTDDNELFIDYHAQTDAATPLNLTNHTYWNLAGVKQHNIFDHQLEIFADEVLVLDDNLMPTGEIQDVIDTPYDFTKPTAMGKNLQAIRNGYGHDQCYVLDDEPTELTLAAVVTEPTSGYKLECYTTEPGLQFYTGNNLTGEIGHEGRAYQPYDGFCLETQNWPDAINHADFPNSVLEPGEEYTHTTCYQLHF